jgi:hypothetical protein
VAAEQSQPILSADGLAIVAVEVFGLEAYASNGRLMPNSDAQFSNCPMSPHRANKKPSDLEGFSSSG